MNFVDDEDLVAISRRVNVDAVNDRLPDIVDACVGSGVDLEHVHRAAFGDLDARNARGWIIDLARIYIWARSLVAIQSLC